MAMSPYQFPVARPTAPPERRHGQKGLKVREFEEAQRAQIAAESAQQNQSAIALMLAQQDKAAQMAQLALQQAQMGFENNQTSHLARLAEMQGMADMGFAPGSYSWFNGSPQRHSRGPGATARPGAGGGPF